MYVKCMLGVWFVWVLLLFVGFHGYPGAGEGSPESGEVWRGFAGVFFFI